MRQKGFVLGESSRFTGWGDQQPVLLTINSHPSTAVVTQFLYSGFYGVEAKVKVASDGLVPQNMFA